MQRALDDAMKKQTSIVIAHRLTTIEGVDRVIVMEEGAIVEDGPYYELLNEENGVFHRLAHGQS